MNEVYDECFKDSLEEYNTKQKRKDRRMTIEQYIESVKNDKRGRKQTKRVNGKKGIDENARQGKQLAYEWTYKAGNTKNGLVVGQTTFESGKNRKSTIKRLKSYTR